MQRIIADDQQRIARRKYDINKPRKRGRQRKLPQAAKELDEQMRRKRKKNVKKRAGKNVKKAKKGRSAPKEDDDDRKEVKGQNKRGGMRPRSQAGQEDDDEEQEQQEEQQVRDEDEEDDDEEEDDEDEEDSGASEMEDIPPAAKPRTPAARLQASLDRLIDLTESAKDSMDAQHEDFKKAQAKAAASDAKYLAVLDRLATALE